MDSQEALILLKSRGVEIDLGDHRSPVDIAEALGYLPISTEMSITDQPQTKV